MTVIGWSADISLDKKGYVSALFSMVLIDQIAKIERACRGYLDLLRSAPTDPRERQLQLAVALDRLCAAYNCTPDVGPDSVEPDAPRADPKQFAVQAGSSFPELGFYPEVNPLEGFDQEIGQGWGLDDLMDIAVDLTEVLWLIGQRRPNDAAWQFRWGYENHWGDHLHDIRRYLHKLLYWG